MELEQRKALYKNKGTLYPKILYEVWEDDEGEFLVDIWEHKEDDERNQYSCTETLSLEWFNHTFKKKCLEEILAVNYKVNGDSLTLNVSNRVRDLETLAKLVPKYRVETFAILNGHADQIVLKGIH